MSKLLRYMRDMFLYCGVSHEDYRTVRKDAYVANFRVWKFIYIVMVFVTFGMMCTHLSGWPGGIGSPLFVLRMALFFYSVLMTVLFWRVLQPDGLAGQLFIYLSMIFLLAFGLYMSMTAPGTMGTLFILLLVLLPMFMIDNPYYMAILLFISAAVYISHACAYKTGETLRSDVIYTVLFTVLGILCSIFYNMLRIREFMLKRQEISLLNDERRAYKKAYDLFDVIKTLSSEYDILAGVDFYSGTAEYYKADAWTGLSVPMDRSETPFDESIVSAFAATRVEQEYRAAFTDGMRRDAILSGVAGGNVYSFRFRAVKDGEPAWYEFRAMETGAGDRGAKPVIMGIRNVDAEIREEAARQQQRRKDELSSQLAVIADLSREFASIIYVTLKEDRYSDTMQHFRASEKLLLTVPGWMEQIYFHNWLDLILRYAVADEDKDAFYEATRRETVLKLLDENSVYLFNFRVRIDGELSYYQIKFACDRADEGNARGYVVGLRSVDTETRERIRHEEELTALNERAERTVARRTAELREKNNELLQTGEEIIELLGDVVEMRDSGSGRHVRRVKAYTRILADRVKTDLPEYGLSDEDVSRIASASALHDLGKIMISDTILLKPAALTFEERVTMQSHCERGCEILRQAPRSWDESFLSTGMEICRSHHEKWNGGGYPDGLKGDEIPISAQIVSVADCYDALTSERPYKKAFTAERAAQMILSGECGVFSDKLMACFRSCLPLFDEAAADPGIIARGEFLSPHKYIRGTRLSGLHILLVDDSELSLSLNEDILKGESASIVTANNGVDALEAFITRGPFDAMVVDLIMPGMDGFELTERIRSIERRSPIRTPIIAVTAENTVENSEHALRAGADACLSKPLIIAEFTRSLLDCMRRRNESIGRMLADTIVVANTDALTHVKSITAYTDMVANLSAEIHSPNRPEFAIVMCDINELKKVNDTYGHDVGDIFIRNCCHIICRVFASSPVYRIGGDEFVALLRGRDFTNRDELMQVLMRRVREASSETDFENGRASFAAGISVFNPAEDTSVSDVVKRADRSMYRNKSQMRSVSVL